MPLPWWASGRYSGELRGLLLDLRRRPNPEAMAALVGTIAPALSGWRQRPWLVPIPSWKRRGNPLPPLLCDQICRQLGWRHVPLLERAHPVLGQHHLNRRMRLANQAGAFRSVRGPLPGQAGRRPLLLVDDILTSGATACSAADCLEAAGWQVVGLVCLARTPGRGGMAVI